MQVTRAIDYCYETQAQRQYLMDVAKELPGIKAWIDTISVERLPALTSIICDIARAHGRADLADDIDLQFFQKH